MNANLTINGRRIGSGYPIYIIAEMSANHGGSKEKAKEVIHAMKESGADAVKLQTYTPSTMTLDCDNSYFVDCLRGTLWEGGTLYDLYRKSYMPWEWQEELMNLAQSLGMHCFSTPFDFSSFEFLKDLHVPAFKIASFELVHLPLIRRIAQTGLPIILSTGMASIEEIAEAISTVRDAGSSEIALLKCTSAYPAKIEDAHLRTISDMIQRFHVPVGLSDHSLGSTVPIMGITQGACIIEKHFVLDRKNDNGPDSSFSMEPHEFRAMVDAIRRAEMNPSAIHRDEDALGKVLYGGTKADIGSKIFRPSIFAFTDIKKGELFSEENIRIMRPGNGIAPKYYETLFNKRTSGNIARGTPITWEMLSGK